jgi:hypothetical protein
MIRPFYTDTCPHNTPFYKRIYGANLVTWLGLFHLMHRIVDTLDAHSMVYWKVLLKLKACFYTHREVDLRHRPSLAEPRVNGAVTFFKID